jgi:hypothetical protein
MSLSNNSSSGRSTTEQPLTPLLNDCNILIISHVILWCDLLFLITEKSLLSSSPSRNFRSGLVLTGVPLATALLLVIRPDVRIAVVAADGVDRRRVVAVFVISLLVSFLPLSFLFFSLFTLMLPILVVDDDGLDDFGFTGDEIVVVVVVVSFCYPIAQHNIPQLYQYF